MKNLITKIKALFKTNKKKNISYDKPTLKPAKDWKNILITAQIIVLLLASFSLYFYFQVGSGEFYTIKEDDDNSEVKINSKLLQQTIEKLNAREEEFLRSQRSNSIPRDPSI